LATLKLFQTLKTLEFGSERAPAPSAPEAPTKTGVTTTKTGVTTTTTTTEKPG
jgi:hypothetical protein